MQAYLQKINLTRKIDMPILHKIINMKKIAILTISLMFVGGISFAQAPAQLRTVPAQNENMQVHQKKTPEERAAQMSKDYNLTEQQTADLTAYFQKKQEQRDEMMKNAQGKREEMSKNQEANDQELQRILGDENYKKFTEQRNARMKENRENFQKNEGTVPQRRLNKENKEQINPTVAPQNKKAPAKVKEVEKANVKEVEATKVK